MDAIILTFYRYCNIDFIFSVDDEPKPKFKKILVIVNIFKVGLESINPGLDQVWH
jgi:hypothetical protein